jgi:hypothetical protein
VSFLSWRKHNISDFENKEIKGTLHWLFGALCIQVHYRIPDMTKCQFILFIFTHTNFFLVTWEKKEKQKTGRDYSLVNTTPRASADSGSKSAGGGVSILVKGDAAEAPILAIISAHALPSRKVWLITTSHSLFSMLRMWCISLANLW